MSEFQREFRVSVYSAGSEAVTYAVEDGNPSGPRETFTGYFQPVLGFLWWPFRMTVEKAAERAVDMRAELERRDRDQRSARETGLRVLRKYDVASPKSGP